MQNIKSSLDLLAHFGGNKNASSVDLVSALVKTLGYEAVKAAFVGKEDSTAKTVEVNVADLVAVRAVASKVSKSYYFRAAKAVRKARRVVKATRSWGRKGIYSLALLVKAEKSVKVLEARVATQQTLVKEALTSLSDVKGGNRVVAIFSAIAEARDAVFLLEQLATELVFAKEQVAVLLASKLV